MIKIYFRLMFVLSALLLAGCGGGGGGSSSVKGLTYSGKTTKADLNKENSKYFVELMNTSFANTGLNVASLELNKVVSADKRSQKNTGTVIIDRKVIDSESRAGQLSGKVSVVVEETGNNTGTITYTYSQFSDTKGIVLDGKLVIYLTVNNNEEITKSILEYQNFNIKMQTEDITINGKVTSVSTASGSSIIENYVAKNNKTEEMIKYENFTTRLDREGKAIAYSGKIYDSNYGYVNVSTLIPLAYDKDGMRKAEGEILLEGERSNITVKYAYDHRIRVEIDENKDGKADNIQVYQEGNYEEEIPNAEPVIKISFPESIYTDTDMSQVGVSVYDPDLDGFTTSYEWRINNEIKGNTIALNNALFKKHDILKLTVTAEDDRSVGAKTSIEAKEQEVLNSRPIAVIESNATSSSVEALDKIHLDASLSTDKDNDTLSYSWKVYKYIPETEWNGEPILNTVQTDIAETIEDIDIPYIVIEVNASRYIDDLTFEKPIFTAIAEGKHIIKCTAFDDDMAENTTELNLTIKPLDVIQDTISKVFFLGQDTLEEWTFNSPIIAYDLNKDGEKELLYFTRDPQDSFETLLHITYSAKGESKTNSYDVNSSAIQIQDINGDGLVDLIIGRYSDQVLMLQSAEGGFEKPFKYYIWPELTLVEDVNGDNKADGVRLTGCTLEIYTNLDDYTEKIQYIIQGCNTENSNNALSIGDFNNDGVKDYMVFSHSTYDEEGQFVIVYNNSQNKFEESNITVVDQRVFSETISVGDINGDGFNDVIIDFVLFENNKDFTFKKITTLATKDNGATNDRIVIADINNDGKKDILYHNAEVLRALVQGDDYRMSDFKIKDIIDNIAISDIDKDGKVEIIENYENRIEITSLN